MDPTWRDEPERYDRMLGGFGRHALAAAGLAPGDVVLDVGPGASDQPVELARRVGSGGRVVAVELEPQLAAAGRGRAVAAGFPDVEYVVGDIATVAAPDTVGDAAALGAAGFDVVVSRFALMLADPVPTLAGLARVLRPSGRLAATVWQGAERNVWFTLPLDVVADVVPGFPGVPVEAPPFRMSDPEVVRGHLRGAGFVDVRIDPLVQPVWLGADIDDVIGFFERGAGGLRAALDDDTWASLRDAARRRLAPYDRHEGVRVPAAAWLITARHP